MLNNMFLIMTGFILLADFSFADSPSPYVLGKETGVVSSQKYLEYFELKMFFAEDIRRGVKPVDRDHSRYSFSLSSLLPVSSPSLSPGFVETTQGPERASPRPLCLVGADTMSLEWIAHRKNQLISLGAICLVVHVETESQLQILRQALKPVPWQLGSGEFVAEHHGIHHYPVLISKKAIEQ